MTLGFRFTPPLLNVVSAEPAMHASTSAQAAHPPHISLILSEPLD